MKRSRTVLTVATAFATAAATAGVALSPAAADDEADSTIRQRLAIPAYFYPGGEEAAYWEQMNEAGDSTGIAIANLAGGPGDVVDPAYLDAVQAAHDAGITVIGYVDSGYFGTSGLRTRLRSTDPDAWLAQAQQDINGWYDLYGEAGIDGIFIDQVTNTCGEDNELADRIARLTAHTKSIQPGATVVSNQGIDMDECYRDAADVLVNFESPYEDYLEWEPRPWMLEEDPDKFWQMVHDTPSTEQMAEVMALTKERNAGYVYVTPDVLDNPWDTLPQGDYWAGELEALAAGPGPDGQPDTSAPTTPRNLHARRATSTQVQLRWKGSVDASGRVVAYDIYDGDVRVATAPAGRRTATVRGLQPRSSHTFTVRARDAAGNESNPSRERRVVTRHADRKPPTAPADLRVTDVTLASATLDWEPASDPDGEIAGYEVFQDGEHIMTLPPTAHGISVGALRPSMAYTFTVTAIDQTGNVSAPAGPVSATTPEPPDEPIVDFSGTVDATSATYTATFAMPFNFHRIFIDVDNDETTGYVPDPGTGFPDIDGIGADFLIENEYLYRHAGGSGWNWTFVEIEPLESIVGDTYTWRVPVDVLGPALGETHRIMFNGSGTSPDTFTPIITVGQQ